MEKIILFTFVVLAAVLMVNGQSTTSNTSTVASTQAPKSENKTMAPQPTGNVSVTTTKPSGGKATTPKAAVAAIQPLAIFVLACAFLGLMH